MQKWNKIDSSFFLEKVMPICLALFFARTVFMGYKYCFFVTLVPCLVYSAYLFFKKELYKPKLTLLTLPILVIVLYLFHISQYSTVLKETANVSLVLYFLFFSNVLSSEQSQIAFFKWLVRLVVAAGIIAILRVGMSVVGITLPFSNEFFEGAGFALVNDNNFYSLFFVLSIILSAKLLANGYINRKECLIINVISAINIIAGVSRRAYLLYAVLLIFMVVFVILKKTDFKNILLYNVLTVVVIAIIGGGILHFSSTYYSPEMTFDQKYTYYKMYSLIDNGMSYREFDIKQQKKYYTMQSQEGLEENLFYKGGLQYGLVAWDTIPAPDESIEFGVIKYMGGEPAIKIARGGDFGGCWQVHYKGRPIAYHKEVTYKISFIYRVLVGMPAPFFVGWWVNEGQGYMANLPRTIEPIDSVWKRCTVSYKFQDDRMNPDCFLNSLRAGSTIEVKDIRMTCDDTTGLPRYVDQLPDSVIHKYYSQDTINYFTASRTDRWRYALELWQTRYDTKQKIFGQGFKYLEWYGEKFWNNPKRYDFPHNPIISSFLYSGIIGGIVYIIFLIMSLWLYWKKRKTMGIFFIMYLCCMFFSMFSGSSHFSFPLFAFLSFVPFVEYKKDLESVKIIKNQNNI